MPFAPDRGRERQSAMLRNLKSALRIHSNDNSRVAPRAHRPAAAIAPAAAQVSARWPADCHAIGIAAAALGVNEFEFFRLAWRRWHGTDGGERDLDRAFGRFLRTASAPAWARQMSRDVIVHARAGTLDPTEFGAAPPAAPEDPARIRALNEIFWLLTAGAVYAVLRIGGM